jgi:flagellar assembly factor FliW
MTATVAAAVGPATDGPGTREGAPDVVIVRDGLPGFEQCRRFVLIEAPELAPLVHLQGLDAGRPSFLCIDPRHARADYRTTLSDADYRRLEATSADVLLWLSLVSFRDGRVFANLRAPVVINPRRMLGLQVVSAESPYDTHHEL